MEKEIMLQDIERRLAALERAVASLTAEKKLQAESISFEHLGGKKVGHHVPLRAEKPIDFSSIGGRCVREAPERDASEEKDEL